MAASKKYFQDHLVLLLLSINTFLALTTAVFVLLRLSAGHGNGYIVQYRPSLGINAYQTGSVTELLSFIMFAFVVLVTHTLLSMRAYHIHRQLAITVLAFGIFLLVLAIIVSNALLVLH